MFLKKTITFLLLLFIYSVKSTAGDCPKWTFVPHVSGTHFAVPLCRTASDFGAIGDGVADDTLALMKAFSSGEREKLDLEGKKYLIDLARYNLGYGLTPSNNKIIEGNGAEIILKSNNLSEYTMINLKNRRNVKIYNLKLTGDLKSHIGTAGQWGIGFGFRGCKNCELHGVEANEMWGDGFYLGAYGNETNEGGGIFNSSARANSRDGLAVARCKNFTVENCTFTDTATLMYKPPGCAIDIEPNPYDYDSIDGLKLINIKTENNHGGGILLLAGNLEYSTHPNAVFNVYIENYISKNDNWYGLRFIEGFDDSNYIGKVIIRGVQVLNLKLGDPFLWQKFNGLTTIDATNLSIDGVFQDD